MFDIAVTGLFNPPTLDTASDELLVTSADNITVRCFGDLPLNWTYPLNKVASAVSSISVAADAQSRQLCATECSAIIPV